MKMFEKIVITFLCSMLSVVVHAQSTHWYVNAYDYQYDMTVYFIVGVDGVDASDLDNYEVAAFVGEECRGVGRTLTQDGKKYGYLRVHSNNDSGEAVTFRVYNHTNAREYIVKNVSLTFQSQKVVGMPSTPFMLSVSNVCIISVVSSDETKGIAEGDITVNYGIAVTVTATAYDGYCFVNWMLGETVVSTDASYTFTADGDVNLVANFAPKQYTMTFVLDNGEENVVKTQDYGSGLTAPEDPVKTGFTFKGWSPEVPATVPASDQTFTAQWERNSYKLTWVVDGVKTEVILEYEAFIVKPEDPVKDGYTFVGWTPEVAETMPAEDVTYTAKFAKIIIDEQGNNYIEDGEEEIKLIKVNGSIDSKGVITIPATVEHNGKNLRVVGIADDAFNNVDKSKVTVIDLSGTEVTNVIVDRTNGLFKGFSENTLIILPDGAGNVAVEGEKNVVIGGVCTELVVSERKDFFTPVAFKVKHVVFDRIFTPSVPATVYLPFSIPTDEAGKLGLFHTFKEISSNGTAIFNSAEVGEIQANTPYIFIPKAIITAIDIRDESGNINVEVTGSSVGTNGYLIGTTSVIVWDENNVPTNIYGFAAEKRDNVSIGAFVKAGIGASIAPYRAYLIIDDTVSARSMYQVVVDETTGVGHVRYESTYEKDKWYQINGVQLGTTPTSKGLYIKNGNKFMIK